MKIKLFRYILLCCIVADFAGCRFENEKTSHKNTTKIEKISIAQNYNSEVTPFPATSDGTGEPGKAASQQNLQNENKKPKNLKEYLKGAWKKNIVTGCYNLWIEFPTAQDICIASNQIYADISYKSNAKEKKIYLYFKRPTNLGEGGIRVRWKEIDRNKPIAIIDVSKAVEEDEIEIEWLGFTNKKTGEIYDFGKEDHQGTHRKQIDDE